MKLLKVVLVGVAAYAALVLAGFAAQKVVNALSAPPPVGRRPPVVPKTQDGLLGMDMKKGFVLFLR